MTIELLRFGIVREIINVNSVELKEGSNVGDLRKKLLDLYPDLSALRSLAIAVNEEYKTDAYSFCLGDEVALIPPVSGG